MIWSAAASGIPRDAAFEQEWGVFPCVTQRKSGAATCAQRGSCHRTDFVSRHLPSAIAPCVHNNHAQTPHPPFHQKRMIFARPCHQLITDDNASSGHTSG
jgi:hypothetical protein